MNTELLIELQNYLKIYNLYYFSTHIEHAKDLSMIINSKFKLMQAGKFIPDNLLIELKKFLEENYLSLNSFELLKQAYELIIEQDKIQNDF